MRKLTLTFAALTLVAISFVFYNCSKEQYDWNQNDHLLTTIYSSASSATKSYTPNNIEYYVSLIQAVEASHPIAVSFIDELKRNGIKKADLDLMSIKRIVGTRSNDVTMLSINNAKTGGTIIAYCYNKRYCIFNLTDEQGSYALKTLDGSIFTNFSMGNDRFYPTKTRSNTIWNEFSNDVYRNRQKELKTLLPKTITTRSEGSGENCCWRASSYDECFECSLNFFGLNDGSGILVALTGAGATLIGIIYLSCIGCGPNAPC